MISSKAHNTVIYHLYTCAIRARDERVAEATQRVFRGNVMNACVKNMASFRLVTQRLGGLVTYILLYCFDTWGICQGFRGRSRDILRWYVVWYNLYTYIPRQTTSRPVLVSSMFHCRLSIV